MRIEVREEPASSLPDYARVPSHSKSRSALIRAAERWASARGCQKLKIETQNTNLPACRFYQRHGYVLAAANRNAYTLFPDEIQFLWYKDLPKSEE